MLEAGSDLVQKVNRNSFTSQKVSFFPIFRRPPVGSRKSVEKWSGMRRGGGEETTKVPKHGFTILLFTEQEYFFVLLKAVPTLLKAGCAGGSAGNGPPGALLLVPLFSQPCISFLCSNSCSDVAVALSPDASVMSTSTHQRFLFGFRCT